MPEQETRAAHIDYSTDPAQLTLITWGSSTCPEYPTNITWSNATTLAIASSTDYGDVACTMDLVPNAAVVEVPPNQDRKSTRLNSSHVAISYAVFCLKKKKT